MAGIRCAKCLVFVSVFACGSSPGLAGEYSLSSAANFEIVAVVPTATGSLVYGNSVLGVVQLDSGVAATVTSASSSFIDATDLRAGVAYSISSGFGVAAANGSSGLAFASGYGQGVAAFLSNGVGTAAATNAGSATSNATGSASDAGYNGSSEVDFEVDGNPAVSLTRTLDGAHAVTVAVATPTTRGFVQVSGTPSGVYRFVPPSSPFVGAADADTPAIYADISDSASVTLDIVSGTVPVTATSSFDGRAALGMVALSIGGSVDSSVDLAGPGLVLSTSANNASAILSLGSSYLAGSSSISVSGDDALLQTSGDSSHAIVAGFASQQGAAELAVSLGGDSLEVATDGNDSWGAVAFVQAGLAASADLDLSGAGAHLVTLGNSSGGAMISADGGTEALAGLTLSGSGSGISTSGEGALGAGLVATGLTDGKASVLVSGNDAAISTGGDGATGLLLSSNGAAAASEVTLSGTGSMLETTGANADAVLAVAQGVNTAGVRVELSGAQSGISTGGNNSSAAIAAAIAEQADVELVLSGAASGIHTAGVNAAGFVGTAIGASSAVAEATLSGGMARITTADDDSVGVALTAITTAADSEARVALTLSGSGSAVETSGGNSTAAVLTGSKAGLVVGGDARLATTGATSHAALVLSDTSTVDIQSGGTVSTAQADAVGLYFLNPLGVNTVSNRGEIGTGGTAILSAGRLDLFNAGTIGSTDAAGVDLAAGSIWNTGLIGGEAAIVRGTGASGAVSIENRGPIIANGGPGFVAIELDGVFDDELAVNPDGIIVGTIELGAGSDHFTARAGTNLDFWFESVPELVTAETGVQVPRSDARNVVIVDTGYLAGAGAQMGLFAATLATGSPGGNIDLVPQGDCGGMTVSGRASGQYSKIGAESDRAPATTTSYGMLTEFDPDSCSSQGPSFFIGLARTRIDGGGSISRNDSVFAGGRYAMQTEEGVDIEFIGGIGYLSGDSSRRVLNNRVPTGVETGTGDYSGWTGFAGFEVSRAFDHDAMQLRPFLRGRLGYGSGFDLQETGLMTPLAFDVDGSFAYDARAGLAIAWERNAFADGNYQWTASAALAMSGANSNTSISTSDLYFAALAQDSFDAGIELGVGLDLEFDKMPAILHVGGQLTLWSQSNYGLTIHSNFKYSF